MPRYIIAQNWKNPSSTPNRVITNEGKNIIQKYWKLEKHCDQIEQQTIPERKGNYVNIYVCVLQSLFDTEFLL